MKNLDKIKQMNAEEMAIFLACDMDCNECPMGEKNGVECTNSDSVLKWLEQEVEE